MSILLRLYPRPWRDRFEEEFVAVLSDRPPSLAARADIVRGAIDAWLQPQLAGPDRVPDRHGFTTLAGLLVLVAALLIAANGSLTGWFGLLALAFATNRVGHARLAKLCLALFVGFLLFPLGGGFISLVAWAMLAIAPSNFVSTATERPDPHTASGTGS